MTQDQPACNMHQYMFSRFYLGISTLVILSILGTLSVTASASASLQFREPFGVDAEGGFGEDNGGIAVNDATNKVYVADSSNRRVTVFGPEGHFRGAWGWNVVAIGPGQAGVDQVEILTVAAAGGNFVLTFAGGEGKSGVGASETVELSASASAGEVEAGLNALSNIKNGGGKVKVEGGPGDATGSKPYIITFEGTFGDEPQASIVGIDKTLSGGIPSSSSESHTKTGGAPAFDDCFVENGNTCRKKGAEGEGIGQFLSPQGVAVDNACPLHNPTPLTGAECEAFDPFDGDVYVLDTARKEGVVQVFTANGAYVTSFGTRGSTSPDLIGRPSSTGIAVASDGSGDVYIADAEAKGRVMTFKPISATEYRYAGSASDFAAGKHPQRIAIGGVGDVYVSSEDAVYKLVPNNFGTVEWEHEEVAGIEGITVNPINDHVIYFTSKNSEYHELSATGVQTASWEGDKVGNAKEGSTEGLTYNPFYKFETELSSGVLYGMDRGMKGLIFTPALVHPPTVEAEFVVGLGVGAHSARLEALVNPSNFDTSYVFQYGKEECAVAETGCQETAARELIASGEPVAAAEIVEGLAPNTTYYFRVLPSSHCNASKPMEVCIPAIEPTFSSFTTFALGASEFPDGRVYELVSPPTKNGSEVFPIDPVAANCHECVAGIDNSRFPIQSAADGDSIVYEGGPFMPVGNSPDENEYLSTRGAGGWFGHGNPQALTPATAYGNQTQGYRAFSADLSRGILYEIETSLAPHAAPEMDGYPNLYLTKTSEPMAEPVPLVTATPPTQPPHAFTLAFAGASTDFKSVIFSANDFLKTSAGPNPGYGLYDWENGTLRTVNVLPGGEAGEPDAVFGSGGEQTTPAGDPNFSHAISTDGSRIYWTGQKTGQVYVRENGTKTVEISDPSVSHKYLTASTDGSKVLLSDGHLYNVNVEEPVTKAPLEEADLGGGHGGFVGILGTSDDLSTIYYVDTAVLTPGEKGAEGVEAESGKFNLYVWRNAGAEFITTLASSDNATEILVGSETSDWAASPSDRSAQVTSDGEYLAFVSMAHLTSYDNRGEHEVYEYDSHTGHLACASCNPTGGRPIGGSWLSLIKPGSGFLPQPLNLLSTGRLFFDSYDTLSPVDTNDGFEDVYEYEPFGLAKCTLKSGCVYLVSSGQEDTNSSFVNATPSGSDAFFTTRSQLRPEDQDDLTDLYDARVGGVLPQPPPSQECASGGECRGTPPAPPTLAAPLSGALSGKGNVVEPATLPPKAPTRAGKLAKSLKACQKLKSKKKKAACIARARKQYGVQAHAKNSSRKASTKTVRRKGSGK